MTNTKQIKITKLFRKNVKKVPDDCQELEDEIQNLKQKLREKHIELFQIQRNKYKSKLSTCKSKPGAFVKPQRIMLETSIESMKRNIEVMSMLSGIEVQSFVVGEHCCIMYHLQHDAEHQVKHGLKIDMSSGTNKVSTCSFPLGFNFKAVIDEFENVMMPICLGSIRRALVAYYDRLNQFEALKKLLNVEGQLFKKMDTSYVEISFFTECITESEMEPVAIILTLEYRVYDVRPKTYSFNNCDLSEDNINVIKSQCAVFKKKPLRKAFKEAFMDGIGPFKLMQQFKADDLNQQRRPKRFRPNKRNYNNDDTFLPEECTDQSEDEDAH